MKDISTVEGNRLIAEFMGCYGAEHWSGGESVYRYGFKNTHITDRWHVSDFAEITPYHTSWSWLMPVVEKIESISTEFDGYFAVHITSNGCTIAGTRLNTSVENPHYAYFNDVTHESKILSTWYAVVQFIKWYNTQNKQL